mgnify:FL=1
MDKNRSMVDVAYELMSKKKKAVNFYKLWQEVSEVKGFEEDEKDESLVICGGGFPLIIRGELRGSILVSGLVHDEDHQVIVDCLRKLKDEGTCK